MTQFVTDISSIIHQELASPPADPGAFRRAAELAARALPAGARRAQSSANAETEPVRDIAAALAEATGALARRRTLDAAAVVELARAGSVVIVPTTIGWLVATRRRTTHVTSHEQRALPTRRRHLERVMGNALGPAIVLEPHLWLEPLEKEATGSESPWARLWALMTMDRREVLALVVYSVVLGGLSLAVPVAVQVLVNTIAFGSLLQPLVVLAGLLFLVLGLGGTVQVLEWYAVEILQRRLFVRVAEDFARRLVALRLDVHDRLDARELANRFFEIVTLQKAIGRLLLDGLGLALSTLVGLVLLAFYHPLLLAFDAILVASLGVVVALGVGAVDSAVGESAAKYRVAAWLETIASSPAVFKRTSASLFAARRADALTREYLTARKAHYRRVLRQLIGGVFVQVCAMVTLLGLGGWLVMEGELALGQLVAAELVVGLVATGFAKIGKHFETIYDLLAGLEKVGKVVDAPREIDAPSTVSQSALGIELSGVGTGRGDTEVSGHVESHARAAVRLDRTDEASELLETLAGLRSAPRGAILSNEHEKLPLTPRALRAQALLLGTADVVNATVLDNLRLASPDLDRDRAMEVLGTVKLDEVVRALPSGLDTPVLPRGGPLSPSERSRLALARALVAPPPLLLLDRALDDLGLDAESTEQLLDAFLGEELDATIILTTKSPTVARRCGTTLTSGENRDDTR